MITICLPYSTVEPIRAKLHAGFQSDQLEVDRQWIKRVEQQLKEVFINVAVDYGRTQIKAGDLLQLKVGDVIQMDNGPDRGLSMNVEGVGKYIVDPGVQKGSAAVKVRELVPLSVDMKSRNEGGIK